MTLPLSVIQRGSIGCCDSNTKTYSFAYQQSSLPALCGDQLLKSTSHGSYVSTKQGSQIYSIG